MSITEMDNLIDAFSDKEHGSGATDSEISNAESLLGVRFPESYRSFLRRIGWGRFSHQELYGLGSDTPAYLELIKNTLVERDTMGPPMPSQLVPVMNDGAGNHFCLDSTTVVDGECPVVFWDHEQGFNQTPQTVAQSFDKWMVDLLMELSNS
jgi:cell wall assembly regulator SMI1